MTGDRSTLAMIREAELHAAREVAGAGEEAERAIADARARAVELEAEARSHGRALADERFDSAVAEAEARAAAIELATASRVERLRSAVEPRLEALAIRMLDIVVPRTD